MSNRLAEILENKRLEIAGLDTVALRQAAEDAPRPRDFAAALRRPSGQSVRLIAELKRASPSKGLLAGGLDLLSTARIYAAYGAAAISVLTDEKFFLGNLETLQALRFEERIPIPLLRKDFILHPAQVYQSRASGADGVLLIAAALPDDILLADLHALALQLGLTPLVEVHSELEVERVLKLDGLKLVGINNRNLATFQVTLETTEALRPLIPTGVLVVAESGVFTAQDAARMGSAGVDAVLVGEALVTASDIAIKVREAEREAGVSGVMVKICGITNLEDAMVAAALGADYLGFNFYPSSPRYINPAKCAQISIVLSQRYPRVKRVGVFVNAPLSHIQSILDQCQLDLAQLHGDEPPALLAALQGRAYKALRGISASQINAYLPSPPQSPAFLLDANVAGSFGGTGVAADWSKASQAARSYPIFLAGGLKHDNVVQAIEQVYPWGVDTASGVELAPGIKDRGKMEAFINNVRKIESG